MAERYHKIASYNSTLVLPYVPAPSGLEAIVIPLPDDLPFPEFQKHRKKSLHLPPSRNGSKGDSQRSDPLNLSATRSPSAISYFILYFCRDVTFLPRSAASRAAARSRVLTTGVSRLGNSSKTTSGAKNLLSAAPVSRCSRASRNLQVAIAGRFVHYASHESHFSTAHAVRSTGLS